MVGSCRVLSYLQASISPGSYMSYTVRGLHIFGGINVTLPAQGIFPHVRLRYPFVILQSYFLYIFQDWEIWPKIQAPAHIANSNAWVLHEPWCCPIIDCLHYTDSTIWTDQQNVPRLDYELSTPAKSKTKKKSTQKKSRLIYRITSTRALYDNPHTPFFPNLSAVDTMHTQVISKKPWCKGGCTSKSSPTEPKEGGRRNEIRKKNETDLMLNQQKERPKPKEKWEQNTSLSKMKIQKTQIGNITCRTLFLQEFGPVFRPWDLHPADVLIEVKNELESVPWPEVR